IAKIIPNSAILINALSLQEAKDSSAIENIITTHDELYRSDISNDFISHETKEVQNYKKALYLGFDIVQKNGFLSVNHIKQIQAVLEQNDAGFRQQMGTMLKNPATGEVKFIPPQHPKTIADLMANLAEYINDNALEDFDSLVKMAIIHYHFETIHPFYDGNGRTGRVINILYLILNQLLDLPILYLSRYIINNKADYYRLLEEVRIKENWHEWILYMLDGVEQTSLETIEQIISIDKLMLQTKDQLRQQLPKIYSKDLLEIIFMHPYTKIEFLGDKLNISRQTASKYLKSLENLDIMQSVKIKNSKYFINLQLVAMLRKSI
ncbi:MAG: Fic family protein, partial [Flavobacteriaceae bacterium]|nr:Fic family protein [Flavobacteriaceae bacterium]